MIRLGFFLALFGAAISGCVSSSVPAQNDASSFRPPPGSNQMLRAPITISDDLEVIVSDVVIPAGAAVPRHYHPGEEFLYVVEGSALHVEAGKPDQILQAGEAYVIPPEAEHAPIGGPEGARAIVFRVHKKDLPERVNIDEDGPVPDLQTFEYGVEAERLLSLLDNIDSRSDFHCVPMARPATMCHSDDRREVYVFTELPDAAHVSALFRGFVKGEDGAPLLAERGWSTEDEGTAQRFFASIYAWPKTSADPE